MPPKRSFAAEMRRLEHSPSLYAASEDESKTPPQRFFIIDAEVASYLFFASHVIAALYAPIQDCDEVYNYWEPTHYLNHRYGMQTWEYSPEFAIRSWFYVGSHSIVTYIVSWLPYVSSKTAQFYILRLVFAYICTKLETALFLTINRAMNPRVAFFYLVVTATSAGMFHAAISYLPSTFAMYTVLYAMDCFMDWRIENWTHWGLVALAFGSIVGWPFVAILAVPFVFEDALLGWVSGEPHEQLRRFFITLVLSMGILAFACSIDSFFYKKMTSVALNIVHYNIFSGFGKGPNIYGTEPWHFYIRNLLINFNIWLLLALLSLPLIILQHLNHAPATRFTYFRSVIFTSPFYIWLTIFTLQPHKEERFMYPIYPFLALNSALSLHILLLNLRSTSTSPTNRRTLLNRIPAGLKLCLVTLTILLSTTTNMLRSLGLTTAYSAPLNIYAPLSEPGMTSPTTTLCLAKEWYRFPSSYHLPDPVHLYFIKSSFHGLLPGAFSEADTGFGWFPGAWLPAKGMNDMNEEDLGKYVEEERCTYLVDSSFPESGRGNDEEPDRVKDSKVWERILCLPYLDAGATGVVGRLFWVPDSEWVPEQFRRRWGEYCLLRRKV